MKEFTPPHAEPVQPESSLPLIEGKETQQDGVLDYVGKTQLAYLGEDAVKKYEEATAEIAPTLELDELASYLHEGASVLDAGSAFGRDSRYLADKGFNVTGVDMSESFIKRAQEMNPDIDFMVSDVRNLGLADNTFDGIWCHATLLHLTDEDVVAALGEFKRVLKKDGVITVSFKRGAGTSEFVENFTSGSERFFNFQTEESFGELLRLAGFEQISAHYLNERERFGEDKRDLDWLFSYAKPA
jgi:SAM-dependent methyltransferase